MPDLGQLPAAVLGNGSLLATVSERGVVEHLWWPHPDRVRHSLGLRVGIEHDGDVHWLDEPTFEWSQSYADDAMVLRSTARRGQLEVELEDVVAVGEPVFLRRISFGAADAGIRVEANGCHGPSAIRTRGRLVACAFGRSPEQAQDRADRFVRGRFEDVVAERVQADAGSIAGPRRPRSSRRRASIDARCSSSRHSRIGRPEPSSQRRSSTPTASTPVATASSGRATSRI